MKNPIDVKNIFDIPRFEDYANEDFEFQAYDIGDNTLMYQFIDTEKRLRVNIEFICPTVKSVFLHDTLLELATMDDIEFFQMTYTYSDVIKTENFDIEELKKELMKYVENQEYRDSYWFRPYLNESDKNYE